MSMSDDPAYLTARCRELEEEVSRLREQLLRLAALLPPEMLDLLNEEAPGSPVVSWVGDGTTPRVEQSDIATDLAEVWNAVPPSGKL